jgi:ATP-dependent protease HslVU (ClpYQ) ATPase subunit
MPQTIISGYQEFVGIASAMISELQGTGPITLEADAVLIFDAFRAVITEPASH